MSVGSPGLVTLNSVLTCNLQHSDSEQPTERIPSVFINVADSFIKITAPLPPLTTYSTHAGWIATNCIFSVTRGYFSIQFTSVYFI